MMKDTAYRIVSESLKDELRAIDFYLLAADVAPTPAARLAARQFAREEEQHFDDLIEWIEWEDDPELRMVLQNIHLLQYDPSPQTDAVRRWVELCHQQAVSDPVRMLFEIALAKEQESLGHYHALERKVTEPLARRCCTQSARRKNSTSGSWKSSIIDWCLSERNPRSPGTKGNRAAWPADICGKVLAEKTGWSKSGESLLARPKLAEPGLRDKPVQCLERKDFSSGR